MTNNISTLEGAPQEIGGDFNCLHVPLNNLNGAPRHIGGEFNFSPREVSDGCTAPAHVLQYNSTYREVLQKMVERRAMQRIKDLKNKIQDSSLNKNKEKISQTDSVASININPYERE